MITPPTRISLARLLPKIENEADNVDDLRETIQLFQRQAKKLQDKLANLPTQTEQPKRTIPYNGGYKIG